MHACARDPRFLVGWPQNLARRAAWLCPPLRSTPESLAPTRSVPFPGRCTVVRRPRGGRPLLRGTSCAAPPQAVLTPCQALVGFLQTEALRLQGAVFLQREGVGHRDDADDHRTHVAKNSSKNQSL